MSFSEGSFFAGFLGLIILLLCFDLFLLNKGKTEPSLKTALVWTGFWISLGLGFYFIVRFFGNEIHGIHTMQALQQVLQKYDQHIPEFSSLQHGLSLYNKNLAVEYLTGYILEESLSVDNLFVMILIFTSLGIRKANYHKVLFWGILGALVFRFTFIFTGAWLVHKFEWILYVFAVFLVYTGIRMVFTGENEPGSIRNHRIIRWIEKRFNIYEGETSSFIILHKKKRYISFLLIALVMIEFTDLVFALDSIPAIFGVTKDPYIIFYSNIFAILGLRSLFFLLLIAVEKLRYFNVGLSVLLIFIGIKMLFGEHLKNLGLTNTRVLFITIGILSGTALFSLIMNRRHKGQ